MALEVTKLSRHSAHDAWAARGRQRGRVQSSEWPISDEFTQTVQSDADIVNARERGRALARCLKQGRAHRFQGHRQEPRSHCYRETKHDKHRRTEGGDRTLIQSGNAH